jgi:hypothetical protein
VTEPETESESDAEDAEAQAEPEPKPARKKGKRRLPGAGPSRFRGVWIALAALYLATVWLDGIGSTLPAKLAPRPWLYFSQVAALFVNSAPKVIDYRAEGWSCSERRWTEVDVRPYFRIDADNKENRFQRALQFYRKNRSVMRALEDFVVARHNAAGTRIGGVRFSSLRLSYPAPGEHVAPFEQKPVSAYSGEQKHDWYWTPKSRRVQRCGSEAAGSSPGSSPADKEDESDRPRDPSTPKESDKELDP